MADLDKLTERYMGIARFLHMQSHVNRLLLHPVRLGITNLEPLLMNLKNHLNDKDTP